MKLILDPYDYGLTKVHDFYQKQCDSWWTVNIESAPVVYSCSDGADKGLWSEYLSSEDTRRARLIFVEELKKGCKGIHTVSMDQLDQQGQALCLVCGVMLKEVITWEAVE